MPKKTKKKHQKSGFMAQRGEPDNLFLRRQNLTSRSSLKSNRISQKSPKTATPAAQQTANPEEVVKKPILISRTMLPNQARLPAPNPEPEYQVTAEGRNKRFKIRKLRRGYRQKTKNRKIKKRKTKRKY